MKKECIIVAGGVENKITFPDSHEKIYVFACDKGYEYCKNQKIPVDYVCGDFDSCRIEPPEPDEVSLGVEILPTHKDDTDLIHAIKFALKNGFSKLQVTCAGGGRMDHLFSNVQALVFAKTCGSEECVPTEKIQVSLYDDSNIIHVVKDEEFWLEKKDGWSLTVLSFTDKSEGVTIRGAEYEVSEITLSNGFPLGQSNEWKDDRCFISVKKGILLVIMSKV